MAATARLTAAVSAIALAAVAGTAGLVAQLAQTRTIALAQHPHRRNRHRRVQEERPLRARSDGAHQLGDARLAQERADEDGPGAGRSAVGDARRARLQATDQHHLRLSLARHQRHAAQDRRRAGEREPAHHRPGRRRAVPRRRRSSRCAMLRWCARRAASATTRPRRRRSCTSIPIACGRGRGLPRFELALSVSRTAGRSISRPRAVRSRRRTCARRSPGYQDLAVQVADFHDMRKGQRPGTTTLVASAGDLPRLTPAARATPPAPSNALPPCRRRRRRNPLPSSSRPRRRRSPKLVAEPRLVDRPSRLCTAAVRG